MNERIPSCTSAFTWTLFFLAGGVTGAAVALLMAPQSGKATRERMRGKLSDTAGPVRDLRDLLIRRGQKLRDEASHRAELAVSALAGGGEAKPSV